MRVYQGPYAAFTVANEVSGAGGFGSRLFTEIERLATEPVSEAELERAVTTLVNAPVFRDVSVAAVAQREARVELLGLEEGYFEAIQGLGADEVREAAAEVRDPEGLVVLVLGDEDAFERSLDALGDVEPIELP